MVVKTGSERVARTVLIERRLGVSRTCGVNLEGRVKAG